MKATLGNGNGVIPNATYGAVCTIFPHAYNDFQCTDSTNNVLSSAAGFTLGNTRFITLYN